MAISITLLALDLRFEKNGINGLLSLSRLLQLLPQLVAFFLSFVVIALVWVIHYQLFRYIIKVDVMIIRANLMLLVQVVLLPISASVLSEFFNQKLSTLIYATNFLVLTLCVNYICDYFAKYPDYLNQEGDDKAEFKSIKVACRVGIINGILAVMATFISPFLAICMLLLRPLTTYFVKLYYK